jgi:DNA-directed RNA polymerase specialized sigma24 family protein
VAASQAVTQLVAQHLPLLRRYARAVSGNQQSGDRYVAATLEALIDDPSLIEVSGPRARVSLYRLFTTIWNSITLNQVTDGYQEKLPTDRRLAHMTPWTRQAFLLVMLEGFSEDEAAQILDVTDDTITDLLEQAGRQLAADIATDVLIIEDEPFIAMEIEELVEKLGHRVIGIAPTQTKAVAMAAAKPPGLILADIQLADGSSGLDAVNELLQTFEVPVIFITAFPERLLTGERPEPAFLITKPFQWGSVSAIISQALFFERSAKRNERRVVA